MNTNPFRKPTRRLSVADIRAIVFLRYGSLDNFQQIVRSYIDIGKRLRFRTDVVQSAIARFHARGSSLANMVRQKRSFNIIPDHVKARLLSKNLLQAWAPYNIAERIAAIRRLWNVRISASTLETFYKAHGVKRRRAQTVYR